MMYSVPVVSAACQRRKVPDRYFYFRIYKHSADFVDFKNNGVKIKKNNAIVNDAAVPIIYNPCRGMMWAHGHVKVNSKVQL
jgi:hypothetical protein